MLSPRARGLCPLVAGSGEGSSGEGWNGVFNTQATTAATRGDVNAVRGCGEGHVSR